MLDKTTKTEKPASPGSGALSLHQWYQSPLGQHLVERIKLRLDPILATTFGYYALHLGCQSLPQDILENCRVKHVFKLGCKSPVSDAQIQEDLMPIASDSTDLVVLMHTLSQTKQPHAILREVNRILIPDGKLIIIDFNPVSLWGLRHLFQSWLDNAPWAGHYYTVRRLRDWTRLLGFEQLHHLRCGYVLPLNYQKLINRSRIIRKFAQRWLVFSSAINILVFEKNAIPLTPVRRRWVKRQILSPKVARPSVGRGMKYDK